MKAAQAMLADLELSGVVADDHAVAQEAVVLNAAPQRPFGGNQHWVWIDLEGGDADLFQMRGPCRLISEVMIGMFGELGDHMSGHATFAHIGERRFIDDVMSWPARSRLRKLRRLLEVVVVAKAVKWALPIRVQKPLLALRGAPVSSTVI